MNDVGAGTQAGLVPDGWVMRPGKAYNTLIGPFYYRDGDRFECGFITDERHGNKRGMTHGGMLASTFDVALGNAAWDASGLRPCVTIQLDIHFIGGLELDRFATVKTEVIRATRSLIFLRGVMQTGDQLIATADGVWKILAQRAQASAP